MMKIRNGAMTGSNRATSRGTQGGSALIVGILLLLVVTVLAVSGMRSTVMQERMSGNLHDRNLAFQAAEAALRDAEAFLFAGGGVGVFAGSGLCPQLTESVNPCTGNNPMQPGNPDAWIPGTYNWGTHSRTYDGEIAGLSAQPRYVIERLNQTIPSDSVTAAADEPLPDASVYRITAMATGGTDTAVVILQTTYVIR
jgi:type IV pilus assembly protein PilX